MATKQSAFNDDDAAQVADPIAAAGRWVCLASMSITAISIFGLMGGWEFFFLKDDTTAPHISSRHTGSDAAAFMRWPFSLSYFLPLLVPLTLYLVIARWTGEKLFRHA
ncbi:hypothetical protein OC845_000984 [Tilletia horrida]|nr:hypothetical protein OC845_000984 [Tilletia horrida]